MLKKSFQGWTNFEKLLLLFSVVFVTAIGIVFKSDLITTVCSIVGIITALLLAKGKNLGQIFGLLITLLYSIVSWKNRFYGEVIIYLCMMLPMYIIGIKSWIKYQNQKTGSVEVNKIGKKEWLVVSLISISVFIGIYYLLKLFNTNELFISTISVVASLFAIYLQIRRSKFSFGFYIINDLVMFSLWIIPVMNGNLLILPMALNPIVNLINDSYGLYNWKNIEKKQKGEI